MGQVKKLASDETLEKFKRIVLLKRWKLELCAEGEEALRLYIKKYERMLSKLVPPDQDPLAKICGIGRSTERHNSLIDLRRLEEGKT